MNKTDESILNLAIAMGYLSYFTADYQIITLKIISKRTEDDSIKVAADIVIGYKDKFRPKEAIIVRSGTAHFTQHTKIIPKSI